MWPSVVLFAICLLIGGVLLNGWVFQRAARIVGEELSLIYAVATVLAAGFAQVFAQIVVALLVIGTGSGSIAETLVQDQKLLQATSFVLGFTTWTAITSVLLDVDLLKAAGIGLLFTVLQVLLAIAFVITIGNLLMLLGLAVLMA